MAYSVLSVPVGWLVVPVDVKRAYELLYMSVLPTRLYEVHLGMIILSWAA